MKEPTRRAATTAERRDIERLIERLPSTGKRWASALEEFAVTWAIFCLLGVLAWTGAAWVMRRFAGVDYTPGSRYAAPIAVLIVFVTALCAAIAVARQQRRQGDPRAALRAELADGEVVESHAEFVDARRYRIENPDWNVWLLRTADDRVYVWFDQDSRYQDPANSTFRPARSLVLVTVPKAGYVVTETFSGERFVPGATPVIDWPESAPGHQEYWAIHWSALDTRLPPAPATSGG